MKRLNNLLEGFYHPLTGILIYLAIFPIPHLRAAEITNTASASGDNLAQPVNSNSTKATTGRAILELIKTGDRAAAEPGDTVIYRLTLKNTGTATANNIVITDRLPLGLQYLPKGLRGSITTNNSTAPVNLAPATREGQKITFTYPQLKAQETLNIVYAVVVTPDAIRGSGRNEAQEPRSNIATYQLRIRPGILSDCGNIIGRVFVDKNFDGEQQEGEPGMANAVIFMDDGNRITTDENGLFSVAGVIAGYRTGTLDLTSVPGHGIAPNLYFIEGNSPSRLVKLAPGGLVRMNFAITPSEAPVNTPQ